MSVNFSKRSAQKILQRIIPAVPIESGRRGIVTTILFKLRLIKSKTPHNQFGWENGYIWAVIFLTLFINMFLREGGLK
jgi:hypothetical protein